MVNVPRELEKNVLFLLLLNELACRCPLYLVGCGWF